MVTKTGGAGAPYEPKPEQAKKTTAGRDAPKVSKVANRAQVPEEPIVSGKIGKTTALSGRGAEETFPAGFLDTYADDKEFQEIVEAWGSIPNIEHEFNLRITAPLDEERVQHALSLAKVVSERYSPIFNKAKLVKLFMFAEHLPDLDRPGAVYNLLQKEAQDYFAKQSAAGKPATLPKDLHQLQRDIHQLYGESQYRQSESHIEASSKSLVSRIVNTFRSWCGEKPKQS